MRQRFHVAAVLTLVLGLAAAASAQQKAKKPAAVPDEKAMMEAWQKAMTPGDMHKKLDAIVGTFETSGRTWMDPAKPPEDSVGSSVNTWVLGNRYVQTKYEGSFMGEPFNGIGYTGYDNVAKKYISVWMDTASTGMMVTTGTMDAAGKLLTFKGPVNDPITGKPTPIEEKLTITDNDHHTIELWGAGPGGKMFKMMEIAYTRKK
jgi:hypothetical protein